MKLPKLLQGVFSSFLVVASMAAPPALATPLLLDQLIDAAYLRNAGDAATLAALEEAAGRQLDGEPATRVERGNAALATLDPANASQWFIDVGPHAPAYFVLKFGLPNGAHTTNNTFFFKNTGQFDLLVFSNAQVDYLSGGDCSKRNDNQCNIGRLSHFTYVGTAERDGVGEEVPEPASVALLGAGLMALLLGHRRRKR